MNSTAVAAGGRYPLENKALLVLRWEGYPERKDLTETLPYILEGLEAPSKG